MGLFQLRFTASGFLRPVAFPVGKIRIVEGIPRLQELFPAPDKKLLLIFEAFFLFRRILLPPAHGFVMGQQRSRFKHIAVSQFQQPQTEIHVVQGHGQFRTEAPRAAEHAFFHHQAGCCQSADVLQNRRPVHISGIIAVSAYGFRFKNLVSAIYCCKKIPGSSPVELDKKPEKVVPIQLQAGLTPQIPSAMTYLVWGLYEKFFPGVKSFTNTGGGFQNFMG